ncbi:MAG TPA: MYXO-CTERM sorting domain-containing protein, partial [Kofleriaceae bacterium]|nr:MYXO-CTERM sorting domain-containing protein [Kofleriaceae bacterium]
WGGPPAGQSAQGTKSALGLAFAPRGQVDLAQALAKPDQTGFGGGAFAGSAAEPAAGSAMAAPTAAAGKPKKSGCGCDAGERNGLGTTALLVGTLLLLRRRKQS